MGERPVIAVRAHRAATIGVVLLATLKAAVVNERTPIWDFDAWVQAIPMTGIGPAAGVAIDALIGALAAVALVAASARGFAVRAHWVGLAAVGALGVSVVHALLAGPTGLEIVAPEGGGSAWIAGVFALVACAHASRDRWLHRVVVGLALGFFGMLLAKGLVQVFVEHPATVRAFRIDRESILAARGWDGDSAAARSFERRLLQPEATGWFGLANVYASFAAAAVVGFGAAAIAWAVRTREAVRSRAWQVAAGGAACGAVGLWLAGSKGGAGAVVVAAGAVALVRTVPFMRAKLALWVGPAAIGVVLAAVAARGVVGTAVGELSLLFRAFYAEAALRIFAGSPLTGVGPGGFQDAYLLAKPAISPEAVASPHSVLLDWLSMLGVFGVVWGVLLVLAARGVGLGIGRGRGGTALGSAWRVPGRAVVGWKTLLLLAGGVVLVGAYVERFATTAEIAGGRLLGLGLWVGLAAAVANGLPGAAVRLAAAGAGLAILVHAQIELTAVQPESAVLALVLVGLGVGPAGIGAGGHRRIVLSGGVLMLVPLVLVAGAVPRLAAWEGRLVRAAAVVAPLAAARAEGGSVRGLDVAGMLGQAGDLLAEAASLRPGHEPAVKALGRARGAEASASGRDDPDRAAGALRAAVASARGLVEVDDSASANGWLGATAVQAAGAGVFGADESERLFAEGLAALERAAGLDPHGVAPAVRLMEVFVAAGRDEAAAAWAREALRRDGLTGLDPLVGLSDRQRRAAERLVERAGAGGPG